jgi:hypothetical protein
MAMNIICATRAIAKSTQRRPYFQGTLMQCLSSSHVDHLTTEEKEDLMSRLVDMLHGPEHDSFTDELKHSMIEHQLFKVSVFEMK